MDYLEFENTADQPLDSDASYIDIKQPSKPPTSNIKILFICKKTIPYERMAIMTLSSNLKSYGHQVKAVVFKSGKLNNKEGQESFNHIYKKVSDFRPQVIGYSVMTGEHYEVLEINRKLKKDFNFISVMGGPHPTFSRETIEEDGIDAICTGEGDNSFPEFIKRIESGEDYWLTETFHTKYKGKIYRNLKGKLVPDLDVLPPPDRQVLYDADPDLENVGNKAFITARGCPYKCSYCFNHQYNNDYKGLGQILRVRSPELVVQEIEAVIKRYPLDTISFEDDVFTLRPQGWIEEFAKLYKKRVGLPFSCMARASSLKKETVRLLADCGLCHVWMGVECGNEKAANKIFLRNTTNETILKVNQWFKEYKVKLLSLNIMGLPVDNPFEIDLQTLDLNLKLKPALASFNLLYPFPGTTIGEMAKQSGHFKIDKDTVFLETARRSSMLEFKSKKEKMMVENLQKLGGVIVEFPFLRPFVRFLCSFPIPSLYHLINYIHFVYCHKIRLRPPTFRNFVRELPTYWGIFKTLLNKS